MEKKDYKVKKPHLAFHRAMSDISYYLSVAIVFCPDESTATELISVHEAIGTLYKDLLDKINDNDNVSSEK